MHAACTRHANGIQEASFRHAPRLPGMWHAGTLSPAHAGHAAKNLETHAGHAACMPELRHACGMHAACRMPQKTSCMHMPGMQEPKLACRKNFLHAFYMPGMPHACRNF
jgi:hypothetical protein